MRVHTYVIATDAGSAPNYDPPCTTLAVCKPRIRRKAHVGELVLAFAGQKENPREPHTVVWAGIVAEKLSFADYWNDKRFARKKPDKSPTPDNFYRPVNDGLLWVDNPVHDADATQHDTSGLYVLVFDPSWRFGSNGPVLPNDFGLRMVHGRRGERLADLTDADWHRLESWLNDQIGTTAVDSRAKPTCRPSTRSERANAPTTRQRC